jgi:hypothetical protein
MDDIARPILVGSHILRTIFEHVIFQIQLNGSSDMYLPSKFPVTIRTASSKYSSGGTKRKRKSARRQLTRKAKLQRQSYRFTALIHDEWTVFMEKVQKSFYGLFGGQWGWPEVEFPCFILWTLYDRPRFPKRNKRSSRATQQEKLWLGALIRVLRTNGKMV